MGQAISVALPRKVQVHNDPSSPAETSSAKIPPGGAPRIQVTPLPSQHPIAPAPATGPVVAQPASSQNAIPPAKASGSSVACGADRDTFDFDSLPLDFDAFAEAAKAQNASQAQQADMTSSDQRALNTLKRHIRKSKNEVLDAQRSSARIVGVASAVEAGLLTVDCVTLGASATKTIPTRVAVYATLGSNLTGHRDRRLTAREELAINLSEAVSYKLTPDDTQQLREDYEFLKTKSKRNCRSCF